jgi:hypothetical protein
MDFYTKADVFSLYLPRLPPIAGRSPRDLFTSMATVFMIKKIHLASWILNDYYCTYEVVEMSCFPSSPAPILLKHVSAITCWLAKSEPTASYAAVLCFSAFRDMVLWLLNFPAHLTLAIIPFIKSWLGRGLTVNTDSIQYTGSWQRSATSILQTPAFSLARDTLQMPTRWHRAC